MKATQSQPTSIRLSGEVKRDLRIQAAINDRSLSEEITVRLLSSLATTSADVPQGA